MRRKCEFTIDSIQLMLTDEVLQYAATPSVPNDEVPCFSVSRLVIACTPWPIALLSSNPKPSPIRTSKGF
jgi:hypothetical protein